MMADSQRLMKEVLAGPFGSNGGPFGSSTQTPMEDALKEHLTAKVGQPRLSSGEQEKRPGSTRSGGWGLQGEEIVAGTVQLARDLNRRSYMDRAVSWLPGALLSRQASIVNTHEVRLLRSCWQEIDGRTACQVFRD
jgi:hypothetical protein